jgi:type II secretory pathway pseudopilin PulG
MSAFTLIELMAATTVLSVVLLMMVGMQDQMSKAWSNANRRTDATREARAACLLMARDLSTFSMRGKTISRLSAFPSNLTAAAVPFYYSSNGNGGLAPGGAFNCAQFFGLIPQASRSNNTADIALVGYYIALATNTNVNGFVTTGYNLFRYYVPPSNAATSIGKWLTSSNGTADSLFSDISTNSEILARNACNLQLTFYNQINTTTNGLNFSNNTSSDSFYGGNKMSIELSFYPEDVAQKITNSAWMTPNNIQKYARSFEFRIDCPKN